MKKKRIDLSIREIFDIHDKYKDTTCVLTGCILYCHAKESCLYYGSYGRDIGTNWLNEEIDVPDEIYAVDLKEVEIQEGNK